jgi:hypothetical protein
MLSSLFVVSNALISSTVVVVVKGQSIGLAAQKTKMKKLGVRGAMFAALCFSFFFERRETSLVPVEQSGLRTLEPNPNTCGD